MLELFKTQNQGEGQRVRIITSFFIKKQSVFERYVVKKIRFTSSGPRSKQPKCMGSITS